MPVPQSFQRIGATALNVLALPAADGWLYFAEVVEREFDRVTRIRAVGPIPYPTAVSALAQGMAYARAVAADGEAEGSASHGLEATLAW